MQARMRTWSYCPVPEISLSSRHSGQDILVIRRSRQDRPAKHAKRRENEEEKYSGSVLTSVARCAPPRTLVSLLPRNRQSSPQKIVLVVVIDPCASTGRTPSRAQKAVTEGPRRSAVSRGTPKEIEDDETQHVLRENDM
jgi:hypothetical protein